VNKLRTTGLLIDKKTKHKHLVLIEEKLYDKGARLEHTPRKPLKHLAQETAVSKSSARVATQLPQLRLYKTTVTQALQPTILLVGFVFAVGFYSLSWKVRSICN
jgi:hypothetical protein